MLYQNAIDHSLFINHSHYCRCCSSFFLDVKSYQSAPEQRPLHASKASEILNFITGDNPQYYLPQNSMQLRRGRFVWSTEAVLVWMSRRECPGIPEDHIYKLLDTGTCLCIFLSVHGMTGIFLLFVAMSLDYKEHTSCSFCLVAVRK